MKALMRDRVQGWLIAGAAVCLLVGAFVGALTVVGLVLFALGLGGEVWQWARVQRARGRLRRAALGLVFNPFTAGFVFVVVVAPHVAWWRQLVWLMVVATVWFVAENIWVGARAGWRDRRAERAVQAAPTRIVGPGDKGYVAVPPRPDWLPTRPVIVGSLAEFEALFGGGGYAGCGAWPDGTVVLDKAGFVVRADDPRVHPGSLVPCFAAPGHSGRHTWETAARG